MSTWTATSAASLKKAVAVLAPGGKTSSWLDWDNLHWSVILTKIAIAILILLIGYWLCLWVSRLVYRALSRGRVEHTLASFLRNVTYAVGMVLVAITAATTLGINPTSMLAVLGAAGLAVGLALKDSLSNIASGVMLIALHPFREGDYVQAAGQEGTVEEIRIFQTRLRTADNRLVVLPNSMITTAPIINFTARPRRRVDIAVGVGYEDDLQQARKILLQLAANNPRVLAEPTPNVLVDKLGESNVSLILQAWVNTPDNTAAKSELTEAVRSEILANGLHIPAPRREVKLHHNNADGVPFAGCCSSSRTFVRDDNGKQE